MSELAQQGVILLQQEQVTWEAPVESAVWKGR